MIDLVAGYSDIGGTMTLIGLKNVLGSDSSETIRGNALANSLQGNGGGAGNSSPCRATTACPEVPAAIRSTAA